MRLFFALPLLLCGCGQPAERTANSVDIDAAAAAAEDSVENYAAGAPAAAPVAPAPVPTPVPSPAPQPSPVASLAPLDPPAPGTPGGLPDDRTPVSEAPFTADSAQGAANVVQSYYALLGERKYARAWALWGHDGADSGMSAKAFAASFDKFSEYHANVGAPGEIDAGMSQRWVTVPVQVYGRLKTGTPVYMLGSVTLHRIVAGVGGPKSQQRWHIRTIDVKPRPKR
ncbi:hypothetical protein [Sphingomonas hylomeconis]|uniref:Lipoprotein n=1 Tax=Sphingomonas hylomeconis TaxID=1395958 RepID=A0ABV7SQY2_9SPHN|nr:hypothetical protein [Sphingomonas hylomeconis]